MIALSQVNNSRAAVARIALGAVGAAVILVLVRGWITNHFVFFPMRYPQGDWALQHQSGAQDLWLNAADGTRLHAWWFPARNAPIATLFLHGNAGNITHRLDHAAHIRDAGSAVLLLDYRGYGKSQGRPSESGLYQDADAAYAELLRLGFNAGHLVIHGESLGTAVAVDVAARRPCAGVILESPLTSARDVAAGLAPWIGPVLIRGWDSRSKIARVHAPLLVIHGDRDEVIPFALGRALYDAANQPKSFWQIRGGTHNTLLDDAGPEYVPRLRAFYMTLAAAPSADAG